MLTRHLTRYCEDHMAADVEIRPPNSRAPYCRSARAVAFAAAAAIFAGMIPVQTRASAADWPAANAEARLLFTRRHLTGAIVVQDVKTGAIISALNPDTPILPLSVVKLFTAAIYWEHPAALPTKSGGPGKLVAYGSDDAGRRLALSLRQASGSTAVLRDLERFGFPHCRQDSLNCTTLGPATGDAEWANAMSLGESDFRATPWGLSYFLRIVGNGGAARVKNSGWAMRPETARRLESAMIDTVRFGTARGIRGRLGAHGQIGGKTGSGPGGVRPLNGVFAGIVFDGANTPRYTVVTYVRGGGVGGGAAAEISADMANYLLGGSKNRDLVTPRR